MKTTLVIIAALMLLTVTVPTASAGPQCPQVQPFAGPCNFIVGAPDRAQQAVEDAKEQVPPVP